MDPFELPDQLPATVSELEALAAQATAEIRVFQARAAANQELSEEDVQRFQYLLDSRDAVTAARDEVAAAEQAHNADLNELLARAAGTPDAEPEADAGDGDTDGGDAAEVVAEAEAATAEAADEREPVTAAVTFAGAVRNNDTPSPTPVGEKPKGWQLLPSAPKYAEFGQDKVGSREIAEAISSVQPGALTGRQRTGTRELDGQAFATQAIARMARPHGKVIQDAQELHAELDRIAAEIPGHGKVSAKTLVAAGGWCAPSEQLYDFCGVQGPLGLVSLPEVTIKRGGIRFPDEPDYSALLNGFHFTEAQLEVVPPPTKPCVDIPCPDTFTEYRLEALGYCVQAGILQRQGWPESIQNFIDHLMVAHQQRVSAMTVQKMVAASGAAKVIPTDSVLGATSGVLNGLALQAKNLQLRFRVNTIEGVAPEWFRDVIRADLALREGLDVFDVSDARIDAWLAVRGIYLQYEGTWQSITTGQPGHLDTLVWPATVNVLLYPAGTFFRSLDNVVTFGVQYPMEQLQINQYTHAFLEDSFLVGKRCYNSLLVTVPICPSGAIGARETVACNAPTP